MRKKLRVRVSFEFQYKHQTDKKYLQKGNNKLLQEPI
jgi:hypothetical protein